ncbi:hypothetical protein [Nonomuraea sp. B19D2]|uniref:hypothetical protein n=1 Tax=Nonomuraea sp. B19D2 TaxID=3159561 RepID=UPI0032DAF271
MAAFTGRDWHTVTHVEHERVAVTAASRQVGVGVHSMLTCLVIGPIVHHAAEHVHVTAGGKWIEETLPREVAEQRLPGPPLA